MWVEHSKLNNLPMYRYTHMFAHLGGVNFSPPQLLDIWPDVYFVHSKCRAQCQGFPLIFNGACKKAGYVLQPPFTTDADKLCNLTEPRPKGDPKTKQELRDWYKGIAPPPT